MEQAPPWCGDSEPLGRSPEEVQLWCFYFRWIDLFVCLSLVLFFHTRFHSDCSDLHFQKQCGSLSLPPLSAFIAVHSLDNKH